MESLEALRVITRTSEPTKHDTADYLALCNVNNEFYIQFGQNSENPNWQHIGNLDSDDILVKLISFLKK